MRIALTGFGTESSMFSRHVTRADYFVVTRGEALKGLYDLPKILGDDLEGIEWFPTLRAQGAAGGPLEPGAFDGFVTEITEGLLAALPLDGVYIDLHGAAHVEGRDHAEEYLLRRIRAVVGDDTVISMSMDPHGNFSEELAGLVDLATPHRHSPHIDNQVTRERAIRNLVTVLKNGRKPLKAWVRVPILLPGERTSSTVEPGATVYGAAQPASERDGILDTGVWVGFAWADEDRNAAAVMVTGYDEKAITATAAELAQLYWDARDRFQIVIDHSGEWSEALDFVLAGAEPQTWITDAGDNVTAGASGDITYALSETRANQAIRESGKKFLFAGIVDTESVDAAIEVGVGGTLDRAIGATVDDRFAPAAAGPWEVIEFVEGDFGEGVVAAIIADGNIHVALHRTRNKFTDPKDPTSIHRPGQVWHEMSGYDVVVAKNGYLFPGQVALASSSFMALTPGGTELDFDRLHFEKVQRPIFPLDTDFEPDLTPKLIPIVGTADFGPKA